MQNVDACIVASCYGRIRTTWTTSLAVWLTQCWLWHHDSMSVALRYLQLYVALTEVDARLVSNSLPNKNLQQFHYVIIPIRFILADRNECRVNTNGLGQLRIFSSISPWSDPISNHKRRTPSSAEWRRLPNGTCQNGFGWLFSPPPSTTSLTAGRSCRPFS